MSKVRLTGSTSGYTEITAPAVGGNNTIVLPSGNGSANQLLKNGATAGTLEYASVTASGSELGTVTSINNGPLAGMRNRIINGGMDIAQRGSSFAAIASLTYTIDRWRWSQLGAMVCTVSQSTDVPNNTFQNSYKVDVTTADSSIAADGRANIQQRIEGYNVRDLIGTTFTLSFWVKSSKTGVHCVSFRNDGIDRTFVKEYTIATANTWEYKTLTVSGGLITSGTWDWTNGRGLIITFSLACGTTRHTTADAWQTGDFLATANQVNVMDNTANEFFITGVQLEPGAVATQFERRPIGMELSLCQRYFQSIFNSSSGTIPVAHCFQFNSTSTRATFPLAACMRGTPSVIINGTITLTDGNASNVALSGIGVGTNSFSVFVPRVVLTATTTSRAADEAGSWVGSNTDVYFDSEL